MSDKTGNELTQQLTTAQTAVVERVIVGGDLSKLDPKSKLDHYLALCKSIGLNPLTKPFEYIRLQGKEVLYALKECTEQLRKLHNVSIEIVSRDIRESLGLYIVIAKASIPGTDRQDEGVGAVSLKGVTGNELANLIMKAETKAKRRVTLSICGLGVLDESEIHSVAKHERQRLEFDIETGEVREIDPPPPPPPEKKPKPPVEVIPPPDPYPLFMQFFEDNNINACRIYLKKLVPAARSDLKARMSSSQMAWGLLHKALLKQDRAEATQIISKLTESDKVRLEKIFTPIEIAWFKTMNWDEALVELKEAVLVDDEPLWDDTPAHPTLGPEPPPITDYSEYGDMTDGKRN